MHKDGKWEMEREETKALKLSLTIKSYYIKNVTKDPNILPVSG